MRNKTFQEILDEKNLSLKEASKILKVSPLLLKDYRDGYLLLSNEKAIEFSKKLNVDPERFLKDELNYPVRIEVESDKNHILEILKKIFSSIHTLLISLLLVIISSFLIVFSQFTIREIEDKPLNYYNDEFVTLYHSIKEENDLALMPFLQALYCPTAYQHEELFDDATSIKILIPTDSNQVDLFSYRFKGNDGQKFDMLSMPEDDTFYIDYKYRIDGTTYNLFCDFTRHSEIKNFKITNLKTLEELNEDNELFHSITQKFLFDFNDVAAKIDRVFTSKFQINTGFECFSANYIIDMANINFTRDGYYLMLIFFSILLFFSGVSVIFTFIMIIFKRYRIGVINGVFNDEEIFEGFNLTKDTSLSKNFNFGPFFRSGSLRIIGLILLFIGNSSLLALFMSLGNPEIMDTLQSIHYQELFNAFKFISTFLLAFILIDLTRRNKNMFLKVIGLLIGGFGFYIFEIITINYLSNSGLVNTIIAEFMPVNILWSTGIYVFLAIFLFTTPKFCNKRWKVITFRVASLIPLLFLLGSELVALLSDLGYITIDKYYHGLLVHKSYGLSIFIILYIYILYIYELYLKSKYKKDEFITYSQGNRYAWTKNLIAIFSLVTSYLIIFGLSFLYDDFYKDFSNIKYVLVLIPVLLLYRPRIPKDNIVQNMFYMTGLTISTILPYLICYLMLL